MYNDEKVTLKAPLLYLLLGLISGFVIANNGPSISPIILAVIGVTLTLSSFFLESLIIYGYLSSYALVSVHFGRMQAYDYLIAVAKSYTTYPHEKLRYQ